MGGFIKTVKKKTKKVVGDIGSALGLTEGTTERAARIGARNAAETAARLTDQQEIERASQSRGLSDLISERQAARSRKRRAKGRRANILTSPQGVTEEANIFQRSLKTILGA